MDEQKPKKKHPQVTKIIEEAKDRADAIDKPSDELPEEDPTKPEQHKWFAIPPLMPEPPPKMKEQAEPAKYLAEELHPMSRREFREFVKPLVTDPKQPPIVEYVRESLTAFMLDDTVLAIAGFSAFAIGLVAFGMALRG